KLRLPANNRKSAGRSPFGLDPRYMGSSTDFRHPCTQPAHHGRPRGWIPGTWGRPWIFGILDASGSPRPALGLDSPVHGVVRGVSPPPIRRPMIARPPSLTSRRIPPIIDATP